MYIANPRAGAGVPRFIDPDIARSSAGVVVVSSRGGIYLPRFEIRHIGPFAKQDELRWTAIESGAALLAPAGDARQIEFTIRHAPCDKYDDGKIFAIREIYSLFAR